MVEKYLEEKFKTVYGIPLDEVLLLKKRIIKVVMEHQKLGESGNNGVPNALDAALREFGKYRWAYSTPLLRNQLPLRPVSVRPIKGIINNKGS